MEKLKVGLQLYSVRDEMKRDPDATLKAIKEMGYDYVELAGLYDMEAKDFKALLDKYDIKVVSVHEGYPGFLDETDRVLEEAEIFGWEYYTIAIMSEDYFKGGEKHDEAVADFGKMYEILKKAGKKFLYHNHFAEFNRCDGKFIHEWLFEETPALPEIDTCWVHYAGYNPQKYILNFTGRLPIIHLKDFVCKNLPEGPVYSDELTDNFKHTDMNEVGFEPRPVGYGVQDIPAIIASACDAGTEYLIVEDEAREDLGMSQLESVRKSREYLKTLGI